MNNYTYTYWVTNGRRRIVKKWCVPAKYKRDADKHVVQLVKNTTPAEYVAVNEQEIKKCRQDHSKMVCTSDRLPVIVYTSNGRKISVMGVQFWTPLMITIGRCSNHDGSISIFLDYLKV